MWKENINCDVAKELLNILSYCDNNFLNAIPNYLVKKLMNLAADSSKEIYIDKNKSLVEQKISDECKDLLSQLYFIYMTNTTSKKEIINICLNDIDI